MKKSIFKKIGGLFLGLAMGLGVAAGVMAGSKASEVKADQATVSFSGSYSGFNAKSSVTKNTLYESTSSFSSTNTYYYINCYSGSGYLMLGSKEKGATALFANKTEIPGNITKITVTPSSGCSTNAQWVLKLGSSAFTSAFTSGDKTSSGNGAFDYSPTNSTGLKYFGVCSTSTKYNAQIASITITYTVAPAGFTLAYDANKPTGASGNVDNMPTNPSDKATSFTVDSKVPTLTGYTFKGWGMQSSGIADANLIQAGGSTGTISENTTLFAYWELNKYSVTGNITNGSLNDTSSIDHGGDLTVQIIPSSGYKIPLLEQVEVMMGDTDITEDAYYPDDGSILYEGVTGNVTITATCPPDVEDYDVDYSDSTNVSISGASVIYANTSEQYTITASEGYKLPTSVSVSGASSSYILGEKPYNTATLTISNPSGNVSFDIDAIELTPYTVHWNGSNYTHEALTSIKEFGEATVILTADPHYDLPDSVVVTGVADKDVSYTKSSGQLTISNPTANVEISVTPIPRESYGITIKGAGDYASFFSYDNSITSIYQYEYVDIEIKGDSKGTDDIYVVDSNHISVEKATKTSYSNNVLRISNPQEDVTITVTPVKKVLESIEITTEPTKKTGYKNGDTLETAGMVVTAHYTTGDLPIELTDPDLKFSQTKLAVVGTAGTAVDETIYVYYKGCSDSFNVSVAPVATGASSYNKITSTSDLTDGTYLIVYETGNVALNGALTSDVASNTVGVTISNNSIASSTTVDAAAVTIDATNKTIKGAYYIGFSGSSNGIKFNQTTPFKHDNISFDSGNVVFKIGDYTMRYNKNSGQERFRYYKSGQEAIQLYKYKEGTSKAGVAINATYAAESYTAGETIDLSKLSTTLVYSDGDSTSVTGSISPSTFVEGTHEYTVSYVESNVTYSTVIQIANVAPAKQMTGIELDTSKVQTVFSVGESFNSDGLVVNAVYDNGDREPLAVGTYTVTPPTSMAEGTQTVTVTYSTYEAKTYDITVSAAPAINVSQSSITGYEGESTDITLELINFSGNASWSVTSQASNYYEVEPKESLDDKVYIATVTLKAATENDLTLEISELNSGADPAEITIHVNADYLTGIEATTTKNSYVDGDMFDFDSVTVTASYISSAHADEIIDIDNCTVTAVNSRSEEFDLNNPLLIGTYTITVEYEDETDYFNISVSMPEGLKVVIAHETPGVSTYKLVTDASKLKENKKYLIVAIEDGTYYSLKAYSSGNNCKRDEIGGTPDANGLIDNPNEGLTEITLGGSAGSWTFYDGGYYLYAAGGTSSNHLKGTNSASADTAKWSISIDGETGVATIVANAPTGTTGRNTMLHNTGSDLISCYAADKVGATGYGDLYLYEVIPGKSSFTYDYVDVSSTLYAFIRDTYTCEGGGLSTLSGWDDAFNTELNPSYASLSDDDKAILKNGVVSGEVEGVMRESWDKFAGFITSYDKAVASGCTNYLDRAKSSGSRINPIIALDNVDTSVWVISAVAVAGLTAIGGYFFYRKRKEN